MICPSTTGKPLLGKKGRDPLVFLFYFPLTQLVYRDVEQQMVLTKFFIFGW